MDIETRMQTLETQIRRAKWRSRLLMVGGALCLATLLVVWRSGVASPSEIRATAFVLVDADGNKRAELKTDSIGTIFSLIDSDRGAHMTLTASEYGTGITMRDELGRSRLALTAGRYQSAVWLHDEEGALRIILKNLSEDAPPYLLDDTSPFCVTVAAGKDRAMLHVTDHYGQLRSMLDVTLGPLVMYITDERGEKIWSAR